MTELVEEYKLTVSVNIIIKNGKKNHYRFFHYHLLIKNFSIKNYLGFGICDSKRKLLFRIIFTMIFTPYIYVTPHISKVWVNTMGS